MTMKDADGMVDMAQELDMKDLTQQIISEAARSLMDEEGNLKTVNSEMPQSLCDLPNELLHQILGYCDPYSLGRLATTCWLFAELTLDDSLWATFVANLHLSSPKPYNSFRELYISLRHHLYLAPHIWFSTQRWAGSLYAFRYNPEDGNIEGVPMLALRAEPVAGQGPEADNGDWDPTRRITITGFKKPIVRCVDDDARVKVICSARTEYDVDTGFMIDKRTGGRWKTANDGVLSIGRVRWRKEDEPEVKPTEKWEIHSSPRPSDDYQGNALLPGQTSRGPLSYYWQPGAGGGAPLGATTAPRPYAEDDDPKEDDHDRTLWPPTILPSREQLKLPISPIVGVSHFQYGVTQFRPTDPRRNIRATMDPHPVIDMDVSNPSRLPRVYHRTGERAIPPQASHRTPFEDPPKTQLDEIFASDTIFMYKAMNRLAPRDRTIHHSVSVSNSATKQIPYRSVDIFSKVHPSLYTRLPQFSVSDPGYCPDYSPNLDLSGVWIGEYFSNDPEFMLFHHPTRHVPGRENKVESMKLSGDFNVPRGEYSFIVPNLGSDPTFYDQDATGNVSPIPRPSFIRLGEEEKDPTEWIGKPIFRGKGQLGHHGFTRRSWTEVEIVVVDAGGGEPMAPPQFPPSLASTTEPLNQQDFNYDLYEDVPEPQLTEAEEKLNKEMEEAKQQNGEICVVWKKHSHASRARRVDVRRLLMPYRFAAGNVKDKRPKGAPGLEDGVLYQPGVGRPNGGIGGRLGTLVDWEP